MISELLDIIFWPVPSFSSIPILVGIILALLSVLLGKYYTKEVRVYRANIIATSSISQAYTYQIVASIRRVRQILTPFDGVLPDEFPDLVTDRVTWSTFATRILPFSVMVVLVSYIVGWSFGGPLGNQEVSRVELVLMEYRPGVGREVYGLMMMTFSLSMFFTFKRITAHEDKLIALMRKIGEIIRFPPDYPLPCRIWNSVVDSILLTRLGMVLLLTVQAQGIFNPEISISAGFLALIASTIAVYASPSALAVIVCVFSFGPLGSVGLMLSAAAVAGSLAHTDEASKNRLKEYVLIVVVLSMALLPLSHVAGTLLAVWFVAIPLTITAAIYFAWSTQLHRFRQRLSKTRKLGIGRDVVMELITAVWALMVLAVVLPSLLEFINWVGGSINHEFVRFEWRTYVHAAVRDPLGGGASVTGILLGSISPMLVYFTIVATAVLRVRSIPGTVKLAGILTHSKLPDSLFISLYQSIWFLAVAYGIPLLILYGFVAVGLGLLDGIGILGPAVHNVLYPFASLSIMVGDYVQSFFTVISSV